MHRCYGDPSIAERFRISIGISVAGDPAGFSFFMVGMFLDVDEEAQREAGSRERRSEGEN